MGLTVYPAPIVADFKTRVLLGEVPGYSIMNAMGERESIGTTVTGEDIWRGTATSIPAPSASGEQMEVVSSDAQDGVAGSGVITLRVEYLDATGAEQTEDVTMNGVTGVPLLASNVRFVNDMYALTVGATGVAVGTIDIYQQGDATAIYNMIHLGGNKSLVPHRMVPLAKTLILQSWKATEAQAKRIAYRIRSTDMNGTIIPGVFCFKDTAYIKQATTGEMPLSASVPALSVVKVSGWAAQVGAEGSCSWWGYLVDD